MTNFNKILLNLVKIFPSIFHVENSETEVLDKLETMTSIDEIIANATKTVKDELAQEIDKLNSQYNTSIEENKKLLDQNNELIEENKKLTSSINEIKDTNAKILKELSDFKVSIGAITTGKANETFKDGKNIDSKVVKVSNWDIPVTKKF